MGDFNFPESNWESHHTNTNDIHPAFPFLEAVNDCYLSQHIQDRTRYRQNQTSNCLDLIFFNNENSLENLTYEDPLGAIDHFVICFDLSCTLDLSITTTTYQNATPITKATMLN